MTTYISINLQSTHSVVNCRSKTSNVNRFVGVKFYRKNCFAEFIFDSVAFLLSSPEIIVSLECLQQTVLTELVSGSQQSRIFKFLNFTKLKANVTVKVNNLKETLDIGIEIERRTSKGIGNLIIQYHEHNRQILDS